MNLLNIDDLGNPSNLELKLLHVFTLLLVFVFLLFELFLVLLQLGTDSLQVANAAFGFGHWVCGIEVLVVVDDWLDLVLGWLFLFARFDGEIDLVDR